MLYTVIVGGMAPNGVISGNTYRQQVYLGVNGRRHVKVKGWEYNSTPAPPDGNTGILVNVAELFDKTSNTTLGTFTFGFLHNQHIHPFDLDLGVQNLNGYLNFTITTQYTIALLTINYILYLEIGEENKYPLLN